MTSSRATEVWGFWLQQNDKNYEHREYEIASLKKLVEEILDSMSVWKQCRLRRLSAIWMTQWGLNL